MNPPVRRREFIIELALHFFFFFRRITESWRLFERKLFHILYEIKQDST